MLFLYLDKNYLKMRSLELICCSILFFACNSVISQNIKLTDLESNQVRANYVDLDNNKVEVSSFKGKKVLINYWATWCGPCIQEMPSLLKAQEILKSDNYVFLLVSDEGINRISKFKDRKNYNFTYLKSTRSLASMRIFSLPTTVVFNEDGKKVKTTVGAIEWDSKQMIKKLKAF
jgi:thiol-disulfide isomerase/thioredoxin